MIKTKLNILLVLWLGCLLAEAGVRSVLSSNFLARGEQVILELRVDGQEPDRIPNIPEVRGVKIDPMGFGRPQMFPGRRIESSFRFVVSSYELGKHVIPPIDVQVNGAIQRTDPIPLEVFDPNELEWSEGEAADGAVAFRYASVIRVPQGKVYENQTFDAELKIYIPQEFRGAVNDWGVPEFEREGLAVWRFEPTDSIGEINLLGRPYISRTYKTTMTALRGGRVEIGPATVRLIYGVLSTNGYARRVQVQTTLEVPETGIEITPLPEGAPEGFDNAVGKFQIGTAIKETDVVEGEPLALDVIVSGEGNLDNLRSPRMFDDEGWKVYDAAANQRGEERRELSGTVVFSQFIRPLEMKMAVPPFRLVYFDPEAGRYETLLTEAIPLKMSPAAGGGNFEVSGPPQALALPVERMTDILGLVGVERVFDGDGKVFPGWLPHLIGALVAGYLIFRAIWMKYGHVLERDEEKQEKRREFQEMARENDGDGLEFLKKAGAFVERWLGGTEDRQVREILEERDRRCFRPDGADSEYPRKRRNEIMNTLRKAAFLGVNLTGMWGGCGEVRAEGDAKAGGVIGGYEAKKAYEAARFEDAAKLWLEAGPYEKLSGETLYNIGNAAYRMGAPGQAALYYRRALVKDGGLQEARQNLRFLERKHGAITVARPAYQYVLTKVPLHLWKSGVWTGMWLLLIGLLIFPATARGSRWRIAGVTGMVLGPLLMSLGGLGWTYFPDDGDFAPLERQAVVVGDEVVLHTDAARTSPEVIDAPPGSLAEVIKRTGMWAYVSFATETRGWLELDEIEMVNPEGKAKVPKVKKAAADGSST